MTGSGEREDRRFAVRLVVYLLVVAAAFQAAVSAAAFGHAYPLGREYGPVEIAQLVLALAAGWLLLVSATRDRHIAAVLRLCAIAAWVAAAREADRLLGDAFYEGVHKLLFVPLVLAFAAVAARGRATLRLELAIFARTPAFYFLFFALLIVAVYAQLMGQSVLWKAVMAEGYQRDVKNTVEELQETLGYLVLFFGALEAWLLARGRSRGAAVTR